MPLKEISLKGEHVVTAQAEWTLKCALFLHQEEAQGSPDITVVTIDTGQQESAAQQRARYCTFKAVTTVELDELHGLNSTGYLVLDAYPFSEIRIRTHPLIHIQDDGEAILHFSSVDLRGDFLYIKTPYYPDESMTEVAYVFQCIGPIKYRDIDMGPR